MLPKSRVKIEADVVVDKEARDSGGRHIVPNAQRGAADTVDGVHTVRL